jgi:hypothetical protein
MAERLSADLVEPALLVPHHGKDKFLKPLQRKGKPRTSVSPRPIKSQEYDRATDNGTAATAKTIMYFAAHSILVTAATLISNLSHPTTPREKWRLGVHRTRSPTASSTYSDGIVNLQGREKLTK